jgi:hypothetical protein
MHDRAPDRHLETLELTDSVSKRDRSSNDNIGAMLLNDAFVRIEKSAVARKFAARPRNN